MKKRAKTTEDNGVYRPTSHDDSAEKVRRHEKFPTVYMKKLRARGVITELQESAFIVRY